VKRSLAVVAAPQWFGRVDFLDVCSAAVDVVVEKSVHVGVPVCFFRTEQRKRSCLAGGLPGSGAQKVELSGVFEIGERLG